MLEWQYQRQLDSFKQQQEQRMATQMGNSFQPFQRQDQPVNQLQAGHPQSNPNPSMEMVPPPAHHQGPPMAHQFRPSSNLFGPSGYPSQSNQRVPQPAHHNDSSTQPKRRPPSNPQIHQPMNQPNRIRAPEAATRPSRPMINQQPASRQSGSNRIPTRRPSSPIELPTTLPMTISRPLPRMFHSPAPTRYNDPIRFAQQQQEHQRRRQQQELQRQNRQRQPSPLTGLPQREQPIRVPSVQSRQRQALINQHQQLVEALGQLAQATDNGQSRVNGQSGTNGSGTGQSRGNGQNSQTDNGQPQNGSGSNQRAQANDVNKLIDDPNERQIVGQLCRRYAAPIERRNNAEPLDLSQNSEPSPIGMIEAHNQSSPNQGQQADDQVQGGDSSNSSQDSHIVDLSLNSSASDKSIRINGQVNGPTNGHTNGNDSTDDETTDDTNTSTTSSSDGQKDDQPTDQLMIAEESSGTESSSISDPNSPPSSPSKVVPRTKS